jgi:16S rRNA (uracil1498-N3)-methyltransferase
MPRFYCPTELTANALLDLPAGAARHVQVLRMQPGQSLELFNGEGGSWQAEITAMTRSGVQVRVGGANAHDASERELSHPIHIAISLPANERMDWLVEKATELGAASITPLMSERSVLRLSTATGDARAEKKRAHWQAIAQGAAEQCGRNRLPAIAAVQSLAAWLQTPADTARFVLSPPDDANFQAQSLFQAVKPAWAATFLIGPEGGFSPAELAAAQAAGCTPCHLGQRVLRAETAPLFVLAALAARELQA